MNHGIVQRTLARNKADLDVNGKFVRPVTKFKVSEETLLDAVKNKRALSAKDDESLQYKLARLPKNIAARKTME